MSNGNVFAITTELTGPVQLAPGESRQVVFNATNISGRPLEGRASIKVDLPAQAAWYTVQGRTERRFGEKEVHQYVVDVSIPEDAQDGRYSFALEVVWVEKPDDHFGRSEKVLVELQTAPVNGGGGVPWWVWLIVAGVLVIGGGVLAWVLLTGGVEVPAVVDETLDDAVVALAEVELMADTVFELEPGDDRIVLDQDPQAGEEASRGDTIRLTVRRAALEMPQFEGQQVGLATSALGDLGLTPDTAFELETGQNGVVLAQVPDSGQLVALGDTVLLARLSRLGTPFLPTRTTAGPRDWTVHSQDPDPGTLVAVGDNVTVAFSVPRVDWNQWRDLLTRTEAVMVNPAFRNRIIFQPDTSGR
jgi:beta-lactam-binding protein with PASTA domain